SQYVDSLPCGYRSNQRECGLCSTISIPPKNPALYAIVAIWDRPPPTAVVVTPDSTTPDEWYPLAVVIGARIASRLNSSPGITTVPLTRSAPTRRLAVRGPSLAGYGV